MPHLRIDYTGNLEPQLQMAALCKALAVTLAQLQEVDGKPVFPLNGTRVLAYPAPHHAVAGGQEGHGFIYLHLRITAGRSAATLKTAGDALLATVRTHAARLAMSSPVGITLHIDEGAPVYEGKHRLPS